MKNLFFVGMSVLFMGCSQGASEAGKPKTYVDVNVESPEMIAAYKDARRTLSGFVGKINNPPSDWSALSLKVGFATNDNSLEHIWINDVVREGVTYTGTVGNDPNKVDGMKNGDRVTFKYMEITDWQYMKNGKLYGHYTTRAMLPTLPPAQQKQMLQILSDRPE